LKRFETLVGGYREFNIQENTEGVDSKPIEITNSRDGIRGPQRQIEVINQVSEKVRLDNPTSSSLTFV